MKKRIEVIELSDDDDDPVVLAMAPSKRTQPQRASTRQQPQRNSLPMQASHSVPQKPSTASAPKQKHVTFGNGINNPTTTRPSNGGILMNPLNRSHGAQMPTLQSQRPQAAPKQAPSILQRGAPTNQGRRSMPAAVNPGSNVSVAIVNEKPLDLMAMFGGKKLTPNNGRIPNPPNLNGPSTSGLISNPFKSPTGSQQNPFRPPTGSQNPFKAPAGNQRANQPLPMPNVPMPNFRGSMPMPIPTPNILPTHLQQPMMHQQPQAKFQQQSMRQSHGKTQQQPHSKVQQQSHHMQQQQQQSMMRMSQQRQQNQMHSQMGRSQPHPVPAFRNSGPPHLQPQGPYGQPHPQHMPRLNPMIQQSRNAHMAAKNQKMRMPPPVNFNQTKFKKTSKNLQAVAIKNQQKNNIHQQHKNFNMRPGPSNQVNLSLTKRQQLQQMQMQQMLNRKHQLEYQKLVSCKGLVVEILDQRHHDNDIYEGTFLCGFGECNQRLHNNINYFHHMWAHLARVLPFDYNENGNYSTTGSGISLKRNEMDHWCQCPHCFAEFDSVHKRSVHYHVVHTQMRPTCDRYNSLSVCHICEMTVMRDGEMAHLRMHMTKKGTIETPYACKKCKYRSSTRTQLIAHYEERHANTVHLMCPVCLQAFNVPNNQRMKTVVVHEAFINHIMRHYNEKNTRCPRCAIKVLLGTPAEKERFERHVKSHDDEVKIPPRLKIVSNQYKRRDYIRLSRRVYPRKSSHKCAFCPKPHIDPNNLNSRIFRRSACKNKNCNFNSTCKQEFQLHKILCTRKQLRKANGTYVPVVRPCVPMKPPPRTERTIYQCEKCGKVIELANLGHPEVATHMIKCGGRMKVLDPPKARKKPTLRDLQEEKFEVFMFGLRRMESIPVVNPNSIMRKLKPRKPKLPWNDVYRRAMRVPKPKSLGVEQVPERVEHVVQTLERIKTDPPLKSKLANILEGVKAKQKVFQEEQAKKREELKQLKKAQKPKNVAKRKSSKVVEKTVDKTLSRANKNAAEIPEILPIAPTALLR
ncbi:hypothetical protein L596_002491 [Steinernema carpocapsae]|uniref:C2H2-type domain-containing protein n=1 Tax=Steinernema carpocapsae TaxID=34508 RepID=A0A4U8UPG6_STECR|nr:hypothetical protein L596_002491 [Steinernema carpocapsae]